MDYTAWMRSGGFEGNGLEMEGLCERGNGQALEELGSSGVGQIVRRHSKAKVVWVRDRYGKTACHYQL